MSVGTVVQIAVAKFVELDLPGGSTMSRMKIIAVIMAVIAASFAATYGNYKNFIHYNIREVCVSDNIISIILDTNSHQLRKCKKIL